jgi:hypothetical protein
LNPPRRGRPRKFSRPSRAVTVTLPEDVVAALRSVDADLGRAIVRVVTSGGAAPIRRDQPPAELVDFGRHAVIVVNPTPPLKERAGVELIPLPDGRALIAFNRATTIAALELSIADTLEAGELSGDDRAVFEAIAEILRTARRSADITLLQRNIIVLEARRRRSGTKRLRPARPFGGLRVALSNKVESGGARDSGRGRASRK